MRCVKLCPVFSLCGFRDMGTNMKKDCGLAGAILVLLLLALSGCATMSSSAKEQEGLKNHEEVSERWVFTFDSRPWQLGHQAADGQHAIREYVLQGETVNDWRELVTSLYGEVNLTPKAFFQQLTQKMAEGCPSLTMSVIEETQDTIIFEWGHNGCHGYPAQHEIQRISQGKSGILTLSYTKKGQLSTEDRETWLSILKIARIKPSEQDLGQDRQPGSLSLPVSELGPLPPNASSEYLETTATSIALNWKEEWNKWVAQYSMTLSAKRGLPFGAYLEAHFEDPADPNSPIVMSKVRQGAQQNIFFLSPEFKGLKCKNYQVVVYVYRGSTKSELLGLHRQIIQSRVNSDKIKSTEEVVEAVRQGNCP